MLKTKQLTHIKLIYRSPASALSPSSWWQLIGCVFKLVDESPSLALCRILLMLALAAAVVSDFAGFLLLLLIKGSHTELLPACNCIGNLLDGPYSYHILLSHTLINLTCG